MAPYHQPIFTSRAQIWLPRKDSKVADLFTNRFGKDRFLTSRSVAVFKVILNVSALSVVSCDLKSKNDYLFKRAVFCFSRYVSVTLKALSFFVRFFSKRDR